MVTTNVMQKNINKKMQIIVVVFFIVKKSYL